MKKIDDKQFYNILFSIGLFLVLTETYKQLFLYYCIFGRQYNWWFFPFQLCSLPMYFCVLIPFLKPNKKALLCTFMLDFNTLGAIAALIVPEGFMGIHWSLTLHGFVWHTLLILAGLFIAATGHFTSGLKGYLHTLPLFFICCGIATMLNVILPHNQADMFYISPFYATTQPVFHTIAVKYGITIGNFLYLGVICLGAGLMHLFFTSFSSSYKASC